MDITEYVKEKTGFSVRALAIQMDYDHTKLRRHLKGEATMETLRDISRVTELDFLELCILANFLTADEVRAMQAKRSLENAKDEDLADEILRRMQRGSAVLDTPIDEYPNRGEFVERLHEKQGRNETAKFTHFLNAADDHKGEGDVKGQDFIDE